MMHINRFFISLVLFSLCVIPAQAQFRLVETADLRLIYANPLHGYLVPHVARCFENALAYHRHFWDYSPTEKITTTVFDIGDYGNAGATAIPTNRVAVFIAPANYAYETAPANERINALMSHELVHVMALDKATTGDRFFRTLFHGKVRETSDNPLSIVYGYLTVPRISAPRWYHEGIAVFMETWMSGGLGRAQGGYDEMVFRTMVHDRAFFYDPVGLESEGMKTDFQVGVMAYLYGTRFFDYLARIYGPESLRQWVARSPGSSPYFATQFKKTYGLSLNQAWSQWIEWEHCFQQTNLDSIGRYPITAYRPITRRPLGSVSRAYYDSSKRTIYAAVNFPGQVAHLAAIDIASGAIKKISDIKGAALYYVASLAYDSVSGTLFYTTDNDEWRDLRSLSLISGSSSMLQKDTRIGDIVFDYADRSLWGIRNFNGISTLVRVPYPYTRWEQVYSWPYGKTIYDLDVSRDGSRLSAALTLINGQQRLILMDIAALLVGDTSYTVLHEFGYNNPESFVFSSDGKYLYGTSYQTGVSNIFRYDLAADSLETMSNGETGFFRPMPVAHDSLIAFVYTADGFLPVIMAATIIEDVNAITFLGQQVAQYHPEVIDWKIGSPRAVNLDSLVIDSSIYRAMRNMTVVSTYPIVEGFKNYAAFGLHVDLAEPLGFHASDITASYTPNRRLPADQRFHIGWNYEYKEWSATFRYNGADFYDLFGPTKTSRKGYSLGLQFSRYLIYDGPRQLMYSLRATGYGGLERLPDYQNVATSFDRFATFSGRLQYSDLWASLGAIDFEKGYKWQLSSTMTYVRDDLYPLSLITLDFGFPLPISHSSLWFRQAAGYSPGDRSEPFANFFFGGFGNNWVDYQTETRYRLQYAFPGVDLNNIAGTSFGKVMAEWILPPLHFRHFGTTSIYLTWARLSLFAGGISANLDSPAWRRTVGDIGAQLDFRLTFLSHLRFTLSFGYARAAESGTSPDHEFMCSLKVL